MATLAVWATLLITYGVFTGIATDAADSPLDMAELSVDDMYQGCKEKMKTKVQPGEKAIDETAWKTAWTTALAAFADKKPTTLNQEQFMAIYIYTRKDQNVSSNFSKAVRDQRNLYKTTFRYHWLHFFLTDALQTLNSQVPEDKRCVTGYRRTRRDYSKDVLNKDIRLGSFTSSSKETYPSDTFGTKTCFKIFTCFGADISMYSHFPDEREVLIPPYEVFKVTKIEKEAALHCEMVYTLESTKKPHSNLNCARIK